MRRSDTYYDLLISAARRPARYKLCTVCSNIVDKDAKMCLYCSAYAFDEDPDAVLNSALDQATHTRNAVVDLGVYDDD